MINLASLSSCRLSSQRNCEGTCHILRTRAALQREHQLRPLQNHCSNMQLRQQGHLLLRSCRGALTVPSTEARTGQAAAAHLRDSIPNEQRSAAEVCPVPDNSASHRGSPHGPETGGWNPVAELRDQSGSWWVYGLWRRFLITVFFYCNLLYLCQSYILPLYSAILPHRDGFYRTFPIPQYRLCTLLLFSVSFLSVSFYDDCPRLVGCWTLIELHPERHWFSCPLWRFEIHSCLLVNFADFAEFMLLISV